MAVSVNEVVTVAGCRVAAGDIIVADASGVIIVAKDAVDDVLTAAERLAEQERRVTAAVGDGEDFVAFRTAVRAAG
jgi:regulator of RNase E activity RraA